MPEGDDAKTARHIEDPDPIGKRRPYKAPTPFDLIRTLLGTDAGTAVDAAVKAPDFAGLGVPTKPGM